MWGEMEKRGIKWQHVEYQLRKVLIIKKVKTNEKYWDNMFRFLKRVKPLDITLIETNWKTDGYSYMWQTFYFGEPIGVVEYSNLNKTWRIKVRPYAHASETVIEEKKETSKGWWMNTDEVTFTEIRRLRHAKRVFARYLNKIEYKLN